VARPARSHPICCEAPAGAVVEIELADEVSTKFQRSGDTFALQLAAPLVVDGRVVLRAGTRGVGEVIESTRPGMGGKPAKLVLAARYLVHHGQRIPLQGLQLSGAGRNNNTAAQVTSLGGMAFFPLGFVGLAVRGGNVVFPAGTTAAAKLASDVALRPLGWAPPDLASASAMAASASEAAEPDAGGPIIVPPPPGEGEVVFFRRKSLLGTGQWFKVRENGAVVGKLSNGAYFIQIADPGVHTYTAAFEPELKDHLTLEVDPGETYFVEGVITKGLVVGAADLSPSDRADFDQASKTLKLAGAPGEDDKAAPSGDAASASAAAGSAADQGAPTSAAP